ncbi:hypothetical protein Chor_002532 [Crotalus horridus]
MQSLPEPKTLVPRQREVPTLISQENTSLTHKFKRGTIGLSHSKDNRSQLQPLPLTLSENIPRGLSKALKHFKSQLTQHEQREIKDYKELWFLGLGAKKIEGYIDAENSSTYDDDHGSYKKVLSDHIAYRYEILAVIGKGSFGHVVKCLDHKTGEKVAVKIIRNKKRFHNQALVEVGILNSLRQKDQDNTYNVVHMKEYFCFRNHFCISFELLGLNLYELIKKNNFQGFTLGLIRRFTHCILRCLQFLYTEKIIHCDLKPENILISQSSAGQISFKVIDFGSSCYEHQRVYTYVQSRFYRSPEVILGHPYTTSIDMWSLGCIMVELYTGYPLFPGENEVEQLACIMEVPSVRFQRRSENRHEQQRENKESKFQRSQRRVENTRRDLSGFPQEVPYDIVRQQPSTEAKSDPPEKLPVSYRKRSAFALSPEINKEERQSSGKRDSPMKEAEPPVDKAAKREHRAGKVLCKNTSTLPPIKHKQ